MNLKIKLCGLKDKKSILAASGANYIGFVFYQKSPRFINALEAKKLRQYIKKNQKLVGLFVNADLNLINHISDFLSLDVIQLHGNEDLNYINQIRKLKKPIIKAIAVKNSSDIESVKKYQKACEMILFDTKCDSGTSGGSGISFDWKLLKGYDSPMEWILAGGLNRKNIAEALEMTGTKFIDVSSGVEKSLGNKCEKKIKNFIEYVRNYEEKKEDKLL